MATTLKPLYGSATTITLSSAFNSLPNTAARGIAAINNAADLAVDSMVSVVATLTSGAPTAGGGQINIWFAGSENGTNYTDNYTGSDAAITLRTPSNLYGPFVLITPSSSNLGGTTPWPIVIPGVRRFFGGDTLPRQYAIVIDNQTGLAFTTCSATYTPVQLQAV